VIGRTAIPTNHNTSVFRAAFQESVEPIMRAGQVDLVAADHTLGEYFALPADPLGIPSGHSADRGRPRS